MKPIRKDIALFFDIDATLSDPDTGLIPFSAIEEIQRWRDLGYACCIATGRCRFNAMQRDPGNYSWDGFIGCNGQEVYAHDGSTISAVTIDRKIMDQSVRIAQSRQDPLFLITEDKILCIGEMNDNARLAEKLFGQPYPVKASYTGQKVLYFIAFGDNDEDYAPYQALGLHAATSYYHYADIVMKGYDKARGIRAFMEHEGIQKYIAFGDSNNDRPMLLDADYAVVMGNGDSTLFPLADMIAPPVQENGLAAALAEIRKKLTGGTLQL